MKRLNQPISLITTAIFIVSISALSAANAFSQGAAFLIDLARGGQNNSLAAGPGASVDTYLGQLNANLGQLNANIAASFLVTNLNDSGPGSLRQAVLDANASPGYDAINFQPGLAGTIVLISSKLTVTESVFLNGPGVAVINVSGANARKVIEVFPAGDSAVVHIKGITVSDGGPDTFGTFGGGIYSFQTDLRLEDVVVRDCTAAFGGGVYAYGGSLMLLRSQIINNRSNQYGDGGGIYGHYHPNIAGTSIFVIDSEISGNESVHSTSLSSGGGIYSLGPLTDIRNSVLSGNKASRGGAVFANGVVSIMDSSVTRNDGQFGAVFTTNTLEMVNSTISENRTFQLYSGAVYNRGTAMIINSTISHNEKFGVYNATDAEATFVNSIVASNASFFQHDLGGLNHHSLGNNLIGSAIGTEGFVNGINGDIVGSPVLPVDPKLGPLQSNGGTTLTRALLSSSPAIDAGNSCVTAEINNGGCVSPPLYFDQRGNGFARNIAGSVDIGAFEASDSDADGVVDVNDNCASVSNPSQQDSDGDARGDTCDPDDDNDGIGDETDNCPLTFNSDQKDTDRDGIGDSCDAQIGPPVDKDQCKNGGWTLFNFPRSFKNQGDCLQYVITGK